MRVRNLFFIGWTFCFSCGQLGSSFEEVPCDAQALSQNGNLRRIFKPCRQYVYSAKYYDAEFNLISDEKIWLMATGNDWDTQPESQSEIVIQYDFDESKREFIDQFNLNPEMANEWMRQETTGIIENENEVWMHPFRANQYGFTEVIPFPEVRVPLDESQRWTGKLHIYEGWGKWSNTTVNSIYGVLGLEVVNTEYKELDAWHVKANTSSEFGSSVNDFWFHEEYGFIKMVIKNYEGQLLAIELISVTE